MKMHRIEAHSLKSPCSGEVGPAGLNSIIVYIRWKEKTDFENWDVERHSSRATRGYTIRPWFKWGGVWGGECTCKINPKSLSICMGKTKSEHVTYPMFVWVIVWLGPEKGEGFKATVTIFISFMSIWHRLNKVIWEEGAQLKKCFHKTGLWQI